MSKLRSIVAVAMTVLAPAFAFAANDWVWTGGAHDGGKWTTPGNWGQTSGYPSTDDDSVVFTQTDGEVTVLLDTGAVTHIAYFYVQKGATVTISGTEGSSLYMHYCIDTNPYEGFLIDDGGSLTIGVPIETRPARIDKTNPGAVTLTAEVANWMNHQGAWAFLFEPGVVLAGKGKVFASRSGFGTGAWTTRTDQVPALDILEEASVDVYDMAVAMQGNGRDGSFTVTQSGAGTDVKIANVLYLGHSCGDTTTQRYEFSAGKFQAGTVILGNDASTCSALFVQSGGTSTVNKISFGAGTKANRSYILQGGTFVPGADDFVSEDDSADGLFRVQGGELLFRQNFDGNMRFMTEDSDFVVNVEAGVTCTLRKLPKVPSGHFIVKKGAGTLVLAESGAPCPLKVQEGTVTPGADVDLFASPETPWHVELGDAAAGTLGFLDIYNYSQKITAPVDLFINTQGSMVRMPGVVSLLLNVHQLTVNGTLCEKKRYSYVIDKSAAGWQVISAFGGVSLVVPYVWTGAGDGKRWSDPANWDAGVPPSPGYNQCVDLSAAAGGEIVLDEDILISCVIFNPLPGKDPLRIVGTGSITTVVQSGGEANATVIFVGPERELQLDVVLDSSGQQMTAQGGGRLVVSRQYVSAYSQAYIPQYKFDLDVVFRGDLTIKTEYARMLYLCGLDTCSRGRLLLEDATFSADRIVMGIGWERGLSGVVQDGGSVTVEDVLVAKCDTDYAYAMPFDYELVSGDLNVSGGVYLGSAANAVFGDDRISDYSTAWRYPGGSFVMTGGRLTAGKLASERNQNWFRLYGGNVYLGSGGFAVTDTSSYRNTTECGEGMNDETAWLGGVTLQATAASTSAAKVRFTGEGGDTTIDTAGFDMTFAGGVEGDGGLVKTGDGTLGLTDASAFTGKVVVKVGAVVFGSDASVGVMSLASDASLSIAEGKTVTVTRLVVAGEEKTGTVPFGGGAVKVVPAATVWTGTTAGFWSTGWSAGAPNGADAVAEFLTSKTLAHEAAVSLDQPVRLKTLSYDHLSDAAALTLSGDVLTLSDGGEVFVAGGKTLTIASSVVLSGMVRKTGTGRLVLAGAVTGVAFEVKGGTVEIANAMTGVNLTAEPTENGSCSIVQTGTLDLRGLDAWTLTTSRGVSYVLQGGTLKPNEPSAFSWGTAAVSSDAGTAVLSGDRTVSVPAQFLAQVASLTLAVDPGTVLSLDYEGLAEIKAVVRGVRPVVKGTYVAGDWKGHLVGAGRIKVLEGDPPGFSLTIR